MIFVDDWAFMDCRSLVSIEVDQENRRYCSEDGVLFNKDRWELVRFPQGKVGAYTIPEGVLSIHFVSFMDCVGLTEINFSSTVDAIVAEAFMGCTGLTTLVLPSNIRGIGALAFENCTGLVSVTLPANDTVSLGHKAFVGCTNLKSVIIPESVEWVDSSCAFENCPKLVSITIPSGVTRICFYAFHGMPTLKNVTIMATTPPELISGNFTAEGDTLHVPAGCVEAYKASEAWSKAFTRIVQQR